MVMAAENTPELKMDPANLYREEIFTDRKIGTIRVMTPVRKDSSVDTGRKVIYVGETQLMTPVGALPLAFEIEADSLGQAAEKFAGFAAVAVERAVKELQELRRQQSSSIVIPEGMPGGLPGKIKLP
jgi:NCAIR mutase (PurE)-related protein